MLTLELEIDRLYDNHVKADREEITAALARLRRQLNRGEARVAEPEGEGWRLNLWVKRGILLHHLIGRLEQAEQEVAGFFELDTLPRRRFTAADRVRIPSATAYVRDGAFLGAGAMCMPCSFVSIGAHVGENALIDTHASVGLCAQVGKGVRIHAGAKIGGVIDPLDALPNIVCENAVIGCNCGIYDGVFISPDAVLTAGVTIRRQSRIFDPAQKTGYKAAPGQPLIVPRGAIVVNGMQPVTRGPMANSGLMVEALVIAGYRNDTSLAEDVYSLVLGEAEAGSAFEGAGFSRN